ncbi:MAG: magnesium transporter, partial [Microbacteriaceae bacterium]|nr:magnesium transporter [Microbacteriaceae bacterium]
EQTSELVAERHGFGWIGLYRPSKEEIQAVAREFGLHPLAVEDALNGHQRPKIERYGDIRFVVLRPARYIDATERVDFGEVHLFIGPNFAVVVRHAEMPDLKPVRRRLEEQPELLAVGPTAVLYAVADRIVDDYAPVVAGLQNDIDEIEDQLFGGERTVSQRIYELSREVLMFQRAVAPLAEVFSFVREEMENDPAQLEVRRGLRDVVDHITRIQERIESFRLLLQNALTVNATLVGQRQNDQTTKLTEANYQQGEAVKRISSWAAIGFAPTLVASVYGMNFRYMPELTWPFGYPFALLLMVGICVFLYLMFKRRNWL